MPVPVDNPAAHSCACNHQQVLSGHALPNGTEPLIFADFKNGAYLIDGEAVTFEDICVENAAEFGPWNPLLLVPGVGISLDGDAANSYLTLNPSLAAGLIGEGCTMVPAVAGDGTLLLRLLDIELPEYLADVRWEIDTLGEITGRGITPASNDANDDNGLTGPPTKAAVNITRLRVAGSLNGRPTVAEDLFEQSVVYTTCGFSGTSDVIIEAIGWYPLQDEADLPTLSAP